MYVNRFVIYVCIFQCCNCIAGEFDRAINMTQKAIRQTGPIKKMTKNLSKKAKRLVKSYNVPDWALVTTGVAVKIVDSKAIDSSDLAPKLNMDIGDMNIRPRIRYELDSGNVSGSVNLNMGF